MGLYEVLIIFFALIGCGITSYRIGLKEGTRTGIDVGIEGVWTRMRRKGFIPANERLDTFVAKLTD
tara:strand:- start:14276 stop:14473 length:198 start_codon:yes stop_codon:yes gene_type:complete